MRDVDGSAALRTQIRALCGRADPLATNGGAEAANRSQRLCHHQATRLAAPAAWTGELGLGVPGCRCCSGGVAPCVQRVYEAGTGIRLSLYGLSGLQALDFAGRRRRVAAAGDRRFI